MGARRFSCRFGSNCSAAVLPGEWIDRKIWACIAAMPATPTNKRLYSAVLKEAKEKYARFPSAYASAWIVKEYKRRGGTYSGSAGADGVSRWMRERWIQVVPYLTKGETIPCGAPNRPSKACRPLRRISDKTPPTIAEVVKVHGKTAVLRLARAKNRDMTARVDWAGGKVRPAVK